MTKRLLIPLLAVLMLYTVACFVRYYRLPPEVQAQTNTFCAANLSCTISGAWTLNGTLVSSAPGQIGATYYPSNFAGADCGARINAFETVITGTAEFVADNTCPAGTWAAVTLTRANHTLRCTGPNQFTVNSVTLAGNFDNLLNCYFIQVGGIDQKTVVVTGNDNRIQGNTFDGSASQPSHNSTDDILWVQGSRAWVKDNRVIKSQGNCIMAVATAATGNLSDIHIVDNKVYNCNVGTATSGIGAGSNGPTSGVSISGLIIQGNIVNGTNGDCIFVTSDLGSISLATTPLLYPQIIGNKVSNCGDSSIEISDVVVQPLIANNTVDNNLHAGILARDDQSPQIIGNTVTQESTTTQCGITVGPVRFEPAGFDVRGRIVGNIVRGYFAAAGGCGISAQQNDVDINGNDVEFTAGNGAIQTIVDASGTTTIVADRPLLLPVGKSITVSGTTNYNTTFVLATANDLTRTYTSTTLGGTFAQETTGNIANTTTAGVGLQGEGIIYYPNFNQGHIVGNRIRNFTIGLDLDFGGGASTVSDMIVQDNWISKVTNGVVTTNVTFTNAKFSHNHVNQVVTTAYSDGSSSGTSTSTWEGNSAYLIGWSGATPNLYTTFPPPNFGTCIIDETGKLTTQIANICNAPLVMQGALGFNLPQNAGQYELGIPVGQTQWWAEANGTAQEPIGLTGNTAGTHSDSGFYQTAGAAGCTTAASIGGVCATPITITWPVAFADANYKLACTPIGPATNLPSTPYVVTPIAASVTINYFAITAAAASWPTVNCTAVHN